MKRYGAEALFGPLLLEPFLHVVAERLGVLAEPALQQGLAQAAAQPGE